MVKLPDLKIKDELYELMMKDNVIYIEKDNKRIAYCAFPFKEGSNDTIVIKHVVVDTFYQGKGLAKALLEYLCAIIRKYNYKVIIECSYALRYFEKNNIPYLNKIN